MILSPQKKGESMSTTAISLNSALNKPYTGTLEQPDVVTIFFKSGNNDVKFYDENLINSIPYRPLRYFQNLPVVAYRAETALKKIFQPSSLEEFGNGFKNLSRAIIEY